MRLSVSALPFNPVPGYWRYSVAADANSHMFLNVARVACCVCWIETAVLVIHTARRDWDVRTI